MKLKICLKKVLVGATLALTGISSGTAAQAGNPGQPGVPNLVGSYEGETSHGETVHFLLRAVAGREGSYLGALIMKQDVFLYRVDPIMANTYALNPFQVDSAGSLSVVNDDPSLVMTLGEYQKSHGRFNFKITTANSGNRFGTEEAMEFLAEDDSPYTWVDYTPGYFKRKRMDITFPSLVQGEASASSSEDGGVMVREPYQGIFALHAMSVTREGAEVQEAVKKAVIFVRKNRLFCDGYYALVIEAKGYGYGSFERD